LSLAVLPTAPATASESNLTPLRRAIETGIETFDQAQELLGSDPEQARKHFLSAVQQFESVRSAGVESGPLEYNIGNCYMQAGETGKAILHYRRADRLMPNDAKLKSNLGEARRRCLTSVPISRERRVLSSLLFWHYQTTMPQRLTAAVIFYAVCWLALTARALWRRRWLTALAIAAGALTVTCGLSVAASDWRDRNHPDGVILDLEDSVALPQKDAARLLVRNALSTVDFKGAERMVRINQLPAGFEDLEYVIPFNVHVILIPKCESGEQVRQVDERIARILSRHRIDREVFLMPIMESALGAIRAFDIASASPRVVGLAVGLEDYTADIGAARTLEGRESFWARSQVLNAARAAQVQPIDTVFSDVADMEGLRSSVLEAKALGFEGKGCIHPRQIPVIHEAFAPTPEEIEKASRIVEAFVKAQAAGLGVVSLGSKMIDPPVVKRALRVMKLAQASGRIPRQA